MNLLSIPKKIKYRILFFLTTFFPFFQGFANQESSLLEDFALQDAWWAGIMDYSWPVMSFVLGLVDGFNPCAMWTLFILLGFLLSMESKTKKWIIGGVFIASSGIIYLAALLTYLYGFKEITQLIAVSAMGWVFFVVGGMAILVGILTVWNARKKDIDCDIRGAQSKKNFSQKLSDILNREKLIFILLGVTVLAFSVNAFELLCSFAIPTIFTAVIVSLPLGTWEEITALLIYDFAYILDDLIVFTIAIKTLSLKVFSPRLVQFSHLVGGILLILIGLVIVIKPSVITNVFV